MGRGASIGIMLKKRCRSILATGGEEEERGADQGTKNRPFPKREKRSAEIMVGQGGIIREDLRNTEGVISTKQKDCFLSTRKRGGSNNGTAWKTSKSLDCKGEVYSHRASTTAALDKLRVEREGKGRAQRLESFLGRDHLRGGRRAYCTALLIKNLKGRGCTGRWETLRVR